MRSRPSMVTKTARCAHAHMLIPLVAQQLLVFLGLLWMNGFDELLGFKNALREFCERLQKHQLRDGLKSGDGVEIFAAQPRAGTIHTLHQVLRATTPVGCKTLGARHAFAQRLELVGQRVELRAWNDVRARDLHARPETSDKPPVPRDDDKRPVRGVIQGKCNALGGRRNVHALEQEANELVVAIQIESEFGLLARDAVESCEKVRGVTHGCLKRSRSPCAVGRQSTGVVRWRVDWTSSGRPRPCPTVLRWVIAADVASLHDAAVFDGFAVSAARAMPAGATSKNAIAYCEPARAQMNPMTIGAATSSGCRQDATALTIAGRPGRAAYARAFASG